MTLLETLKATLKEGEKNLDDIRWIGCKDFSIPIENFLELAARIQDHFGADIAIDLVVVGNDFWVERDSLHSGEIWVLRKSPIKPKIECSLKTLTAKDLTEEEERKATIDLRNVDDEKRPYSYLPYSRLWMMLYKE